MWDVRTGILLSTCEAPGSYSGSANSDSSDEVTNSDSSGDRPFVITKLACTLDDESLVSATDDGQVTIWSIGPGQIKSTFSVGFHAHRVELSSDGQKVAIASFNGTVYLLDVFSGQLECSLPTSPNIFGLAFSRKGRILVIAERDNHIKLWNIASGVIENSVPWRGIRVTFSSSDKELAFISQSHGSETVAVWDVALEELRIIKQYCSEKISSLSYSPDGKIIACCLSYCSIKLVEVHAKQGTLQTNLAETGDSISRIICAPFGRLVVTAHGSGFIKTWSLVSGQMSLLQAVKGHRAWVRNLAFSSDTRLIASCSNDGTVKIWSISAGRLQLFRVLEHDELHGTPNPNPGAAQVIFSSTGNLIASMIFYRAFKIWEVCSGRLLYTIPIKRHVDFRERLQQLQIDVNGRLSSCKDIFPDIINEEEFISRRDSWLLRNDHRLLWLPPDYRTQIVIRSGTVIVGLTTGRIISFVISIDELHRTGLFEAQDVQESINSRSSSYNQILES